MGSDMYMMERDFRPRANFAEWEGNSLLIWRDSIDGYKLFWEGPVSNDNEDLILKLVKEIPARPEPVVPISQKIAEQLALEGVIRDVSISYVQKLIEDMVKIDEAVPEREDGRILPKPMFTKTQAKKEFLKYEDCPHRKGGHQGTVCFQEGDMCPKCGWTL